VKQSRGEQNEAVGGGGMHPRPFEHHLAMSNGDGVGKQIRRGGKVV